MMFLRRPLLVAALIVPLVLTAAFAGDGTKSPSRAFNIGVSDSLIRGQTSSTAALIQVQPLAEVFAMIGSVRPQFQFDNPEGLAKSLNENKIQLAVMPGIELGWLGNKADGLTPIALAYTNDIRLKAYLITRNDEQVHKMEDLQGKKIALPRRLQHHTQVFLHTSIANTGGQPTGYFGKSHIASDVDAAIEAVLEKEASVVVVDGLSWEVYKERKPARAKRLKIVAESPTFPTSALVVKPGNIDPDQLQHLKEGLFTADQKPFCRQILNFWRISKFVPASPEYDQLVKNIVKDIPKPIIPANFLENK
jgi:ABC-type phosphate/phosphonate transport system substrate-binding protein